MNCPVCKAGPGAICDLRGATRMWHHCLNCGARWDSSAVPWLHIITVAVALAMVSWGLFGCGGQAPTEPQPFGWCCGDLCGLDGADADVLIETSCSCDGIVRPVDGSRMGDCIDDGRPR